ncbi:MAG: FecR domain-containing protein, partial [Clostridiales bacterium]|nr:FecR domain-containing protein [Clostridiales bacterium]
MRRIISALIVFLLVFQVATPVFAATQTARNIVIFEVEGEEATMTRGAARSFAARANQRMGNGYTISTGRDSFVWLLLDEDSVVKIDQNSKIQFGNARGNNLSISVLSGAITTNTAAQSAGNSVNVRAGNSALAVRGTLFVVENLPDNRVVITMLAGSGSVNDIPLEAGEFLQIFDTESERVYETQTLVIDQELSLSVLTAILDNISYVIEAGLIDTEAAEIVIAQVEELMQEAIEALEEERAARDAEIEAEAEAAPPVPEPTTPAATPPVTEPETEPPTEPPTTPPPTEPPTTPPPTTPPPTEPPTEPPPNPDDVAIAGARAAIEGAVFGAIQANVGNVDQARAVVQGVLDGLELHGTAVEIVDGAFTAATAGNATTPNGTNGSFTFTAEINKTAGTQQITNQLTLTITATPYDPSIQANIDITNARIAIEAATFSATQANVGDIAQARAAVQAVLDGLNLHGTATEIVDGTFANATAGTATNPAGTGGSFAFTVEINKTAGTQQTTNQQTLTISATPYDPSIQANIDITNARIAIQAATFAAIQANVGDVAQARAAVQAVLDGLNLHGTATEIVDGTFANATAGTATTPNGINGSFAFTVEINKTAGTQQITNQLTLTITATPYDPSIQANIDITNARTAIEAATF